MCLPGGVWKVRADLCPQGDEFPRTRRGLTDGKREITHLGIKQRCFWGVRTPDSQPLGGSLWFSVSECDRYESHGSTEETKVHQGPGEGQRRRGAGGAPGLRSRLGTREAGPRGPEVSATPVWGRRPMCRSPRLGLLSGDKWIPQCARAEALGRGLWQGPVPPWPGCPTWGKPARGGSPASEPNPGLHGKPVLPRRQERSGRPGGGWRPSMHFPFLEVWAWLRGWPVTSPSSWKEKQPVRG